MRGVFLSFVNRAPLYPFVCTCCWWRKKGLCFVSNCKKTEKENSLSLSFLLNRRHLPVLDPRRVHTPGPLLEVGLVLGVPSFVPDDLAVAFERQDVRREPVEEPSKFDFVFSEVGFFRSRASR